jgi:phage repressor protein C with HTH and peptisase S24 domain
MFMKTDTSAIFERIKKELEEQGKTREWFCVSVGVKPESYSQNWTHWSSRGFPSGRIQPAALCLGVTVEWLAFGRAPKYQKTLNALLEMGVDVEQKNTTLADIAPMGRSVSIEKHETHEAKGSTYLPVRFANVSLQAGVTGYAVDYLDEEMEPIFFRANWFIERRLKPEKIIACKVTGDSMEPTLYSGDVVLINLETTEPIDGRVFAVNYEGQLVIKRLTRDAGAWHLQSDNANKTLYPNKACTGDICQVIGQIVHRQSENI